MSGISDTPRTGGHTDWTPAAQEVSRREPNLLATGLWFLQHLAQVKEADDSLDYSDDFDESSDSEIDEGKK